MNARPRAAAWHILHDLKKSPEHDAPLPAIINDVTRRFRLDRRDAGLLTELVYGMLRAESRLEWLLNSYLPRPELLPPGLYTLIKLATYELLFLIQIPARATIHEFAGLASKRFGTRLGGMANAVLRSVQRAQSELKQMDHDFLRQDAAKTGLADIARLGALPVWLAEQWVAQYGPAAARALAGHSISTPSPSWRVNIAQAEYKAALQTLFDLGAIWLGERGLYFPPDKSLRDQRNDSAAKLEKDGFISRQGSGSINVMEYLIKLIPASILSGEHLVWDACCGRGGKTCALLEAGVKVSLASDPNPSRLQDLERALSRLGLPKPKIVCGSVAEILDFAPAPPEQALRPARPGPSPPPSTNDKTFHLILLDVPCSGTGTLARNPELRIRLSPERIKTITALQASLLDAAWQALKPDGLLAYITCAVNLAENEEQIHTVLNNHQDAKLHTQILFRPQLPGQDILFLAVLRKNTDN